MLTCLRRNPEYIKKKISSLDYYFSLIVNAENLKLEFTPLLGKKISKRMSLRFTFV